MHCLHNIRSLEGVGGVGMEGGKCKQEIQVLGVSPTVGTPQGPVMGGS